MIYAFLLIQTILHVLVLDFTQNLFFLGIFMFPFATYTFLKHDFVVQRRIYALLYYYMNLKFENEKYEQRMLFYFYKYFFI